MADNFQPGSGLPVAWKPTNGAFAELNIKGFSLDEDGAAADVSHTGHGGRTARLACKGDHKGTVNASLDLDAPVYAAPPSIRFGARGLMRFYTSAEGAGKFIELPMMVLKVHYETALENEIRYSFDVGEDVRGGGITYPEA